MSKAPTLTTYTFHVFGGDIENPESHTVHAIGRDIQRAEQLFAANGWGKTTDRPMTSAAVCSYFSMMRTNLFSGTWKDFEDWYLSVEADEPVKAVPTDAEPEPA